MPIKKSEQKYEVHGFDCEVVSEDKAPEQIWKYRPGKKGARNVRLVFYKSLKVFQWQCLVFGDVWLAFPGFYVLKAVTPTKRLPRMSETARAE